MTGTNTQIDGIPGDPADRSGDPIVLTRPNEVGAQWLVTGYEAYKLVARDRRFSADHFHPGYPSVFPVRRQTPPDGSVPWRTYSGMDAPAHGCHRRLVAPEFTARRVATLRPWLRRLVRHRLNQMFQRQDSADLERDFAVPVAAEVICGLLGVPKNRIEAWGKYSEVLVGDGKDQAAVAGASTGFRRELADFVGRKERVPGPDLTSRLIGTYRRESHYASEQILELVGSVFLAGMNSTASMIALGALTLIDVPEAAGAITLDEPGSSESCVDELLRFHSVADRVTARVALEAVRIGRHTIRPGEGVVASSAAANRDPSVFTNPDVVDACRTSASHVAFGYGPHRCLGEHLARLEIQVALSALFGRYPGLTLADGHPRPRVDNSRVFRGFAEPLMVSSPNGLR